MKSFFDVLRNPDQGLFRSYYLSAALWSASVGGGQWSPLSEDAAWHWVREAHNFCTARQIEFTLVITQSEDDAYQFFETQNTGGVRLSGPDIIKAHHLRAIDKPLQSIGVYDPFKGFKKLKKIEIGSLTLIFLVRNQLSDKL